MISSGVNQVAAAIGTAPTSKSTDTQLSQVWKCHGAPRPFKKLLFFRYFCGKDVQTWKVFRFPYACSYCLRHWDFTGTANDIHQSMRVSTVRRMFAGSWKSHVSLVSTSVLKTDQLRVKFQCSAKSFPLLLSYVLQDWTIPCEILPTLRHCWSFSLQRVKCLHNQLSRLRVDALRLILFILWFSSQVSAWVALPPVTKCSMFWEATYYISKR
jgi:hypothetical protein